MDWKIEIRKASNGYILSHEDVCEEGVICKHEEVCEFDDDTADNERQAFIKALYILVNYFGLQYQKHHKESEKFIKISLVDEDKYFDED